MAYSTPKGGLVQIARKNLYAIIESPLTQEREPHIIQMFIYIEEVKCVIKVIIFIVVTYLLYIITYTQDNNANKVRSRNFQKGRAIESFPDQ